MIKGQAVVVSAVMLAFACGAHAAPSRPGAPAQDTVLPPSGCGDLVSYPTPDPKDLCDGRKCDPLIDAKSEPFRRVLGGFIGRSEDDPAGGEGEAAELEALFTGAFKAAGEPVVLPGLWSCPSPTGAGRPNASN